jgi:PLP dependent protein
MDGQSPEKSIAENIARTNEKISNAVKKSGRTPGSVRVVAVSKTKPVSMIKAARSAGFADFGENYVQELVEKMSALPDYDLRWHYIGALQRNKCKQIVGRVHLIHSVDRLELAREISKLATQQNIVQNILIQIKIGDEESKSGLAVENSEQVVLEIATLPGLAIKGLMTFPPMYENPEDARADFRKLARLREQFKKSISTHGFDDLSMGTSHDYFVAIEEGATLVRIGTDIFGARESKEQS